MQDVLQCELDVHAGPAGYDQSTGVKGVKVSTDRLTDLHERLYVPTTPNDHDYNVQTWLRNVRIKL